MQTKELITMFRANLEADKVVVEKVRTMVQEVIDQLVVANAELIVAIDDEKQFFAVIDGILSETVTNKQLEEAIKLPFYLEAFDGVVVDQYRPQLQTAILGFLDRILDKVFGPDWFAYFKEKAAGVIAGYKK